MNLRSILDFRPEYMNFAHFLEVSYKGKPLYLDGDTITVRSYLAQHKESVASIRFARINAPELSEPGGKESRDALRKLLSGKLLLLCTQKNKDSRTLSRYIGEVYIDDEQGRIMNVNDWMVTNGHATYEKY